MKKFINDPQNITRELLEGFSLAYSDYVRLEPDNIIVSRGIETADRATVVSAGGSGHEPAISGYVGSGMVDVSVVGDIFTAPSAEAAVKGIKLADRGKGVLFVALNHPGDLLTANTAVAECRRQGIDVRMVIVQDDISNAPRSRASERRGLVGCVPVYKIAGAAAAKGKSIDEVAATAQRFADNMATLAVGVSGATHPVTGKLLAEFGDDDMEIGMGQHGEEGGGRQRLRTADDTAKMMIAPLIRDLRMKKGEKAMLLLDGTGATTLMELFIVYRKCAEYMKGKGIEIAARGIGEFLTVQEAAGFQMLLARMDDELLSLWETECDTPYYKRSQKPFEG